MIDLSKAAQTARGDKCNHEIRGRGHLSQWVRSLQLCTHARGSTQQLSIRGYGAVRRCTANCFDCLRSSGAIVARGKFHKGDEGQVRSRPWRRPGQEHQVRLVAWGCGRFAKQPLPLYHVPPLPRLACMQAGQVLVVECLICLARAPPSTRLECAHGVEAFRYPGMAGTLVRQGESRCNQDFWPLWSGLGRICSGGGPSRTGGFVGFCLNMVQTELNLN